ncbi:hypothetical protein FV139_02900 [Parahaliea maris]|uniref:ABM domain-containing protein n=1 Tax=Parahaliea maris TaxID=2716870 RepID=A0A5C9A8I9_9GAMM|nr:hypothetical protein [Parahaliea maris]TXS96449.1 hypothetical protein FV139_02900 [Parahaliea maris]
MEENTSIRIIVEMEINNDVPEKKLKECLSKLSMHAMERNPETMEYSYFINQNEKKLVVLERYSSPNAVIDHHNNNDKKLIEKLMSYAVVTSIKILGSVSQELKQIVESFGDIEIYQYVAGYSR